MLLKLTLDLAKDPDEKKKTTQKISDSLKNGENQ
jgi:hypothetical protein